MLHNGLWRALTILLRSHQLLKIGLGRGFLKMVEIAQGVLFVLAGTCLYGLVGFLFRDQIGSGPTKAQTAGGDIIDIAARHSLLGRKRQ